MTAVFRHDALAYIRADRYGERGKCRNAQLKATRFGSGMGLGKGMGEDGRLECPAAISQWWHQVGQ